MSQKLIKRPWSPKNDATRTIGIHSVFQKEDFIEYRWIKELKYISVDKDIVIVLFVNYRFFVYLS